MTNPYRTPCKERITYANNPILYYQYAEQQFSSLARAFQYKAMIVGENRNYIEYNGVIYHQEPTENRSLLNSLQDGGYILYVRHGDANVGSDQPHLNFQDCTTQRNLSDEGRRQAAVYGEIFRRLRIPVTSPIESSPFCRTIETAALAFRDKEIHINPIGYEIYRLDDNLSPIEKTRILNDLNAVLESQPPIGSNKVIIAHSFPTGVGLGPIPSMGTVVVKPHGLGNGYEIVAKLSLEELAHLGG
ncbi:histidine phosphatase family protein [Paenibacillus marinisediminis]